MADESDGVQESLEAGLRVALTVAGRAGEVLARAREQAAREAEAAGAEQARQLRARLDAERAAARAALAPLQHGQWWDRASPGEVAQAWETARAWAGLDPDAERAVDRVRAEVRQRYGVDVDDARPEAGALAEALAAAEAARGPARDGRDTGAEAEARRLLTGADAPQARGYDSQERRAELAQALHGAVDPEVAQARVLADTSQARPAVDAIAAGAARAPVARRAAGRPGRPLEQARTPGR
jgi:colicin import membrane protein